MFFKKLIIFSIVIVFLIIFLLEILENYTKFSNAHYLCFRPRCQELKEILQPKIDEEMIRLIDDLKNKKMNRKKISKKEYYEAAEKIIIEFDPNKLPKPFGINGIACGDVAFVRNDLPTEAKKYVKRHELEHLLGNYDEFSVNLIAGKEYPLGLFQVVLFSIKNRAKCYDSLIYYIGSLWRNFKTYFVH